MADIEIGAGTIFHALQKYGGTTEIVVRLHWGRSFVSSTFNPDETFLIDWSGTGFPEYVDSVVRRLSVEEFVKSARKVNRHPLSPKEEYDLRSWYQRGVRRVG